MVPVRFDPVTKWALEISATQDRRPLGSMIEYLVALAMRDHPLPRGKVGPFRRCKPLKNAGLKSILATIQPV